MFLNRKFILFFLIICSYQISLAQVNPKPQDTSKVFRKIEKYSKKKKVTKFLHKLVFKPVAKQKIKKNSFHRIKRPSYMQYEGKIIRQINVITLDPFGYSEIDTTIKPKKFIYKAGNSLHTKTKSLAIKNLLLIKRNTPLDSLLVRESERLIRAQHYIRGVKINTYLTAQNSDSVDVEIRVLDSWSMIPNFSTSTSKSSFNLIEKNFAGTGHEFSNTYTNSLTSTRNGYKTTYTIPSILNTFIKTTINYSIDLDGNYFKSIDVNRPFFSSYARWGAGVNLSQQYVKFITIDTSQVEHTLAFKYNSQDYWAGHSFRISEGNTEDDWASNLVTSVRYYKKNYVEKPLLLKDSLGIFSSEALYLVGIGISSRKFTQDKNVFFFNVVEDIASGVIYNLTGGYQKKNNIFRPYLGARFALGKYYEFGYLSGNIEYGTFIQESKTVQSTINFSAVYFTNLIEGKTWKFRQFIKPQVIIGNNRINSDSDRLTLNGDTGINGFNDLALFGTKKLLLTFQTQGYSPWRVFGFRMNPYLSFSMGMLGQENTDFKRSKVYSQFGAGIIVSNDYLVFHSFQFSLSYYPSMNNDAGSIFKTNSIKSYDFGLQNFEINKPLVVPYQ